MTKEQYQQKAFKWLSEVYPSEVELLGLDATKDILEGCWLGEAFREEKRKFGGRTMETIEIVKLVFSAAGFIKALLDIWKFFRDKGKKPTETELREELKKRIPVKEWPSDHGKLIALCASEDGGQLGGA